MTDEIAPADPRLRRNAILIVVGGAIVGSVIIGWLWPMARDALMVARAEGRVSARAICTGAVILLALFSALPIVSGINMIGVGTRTIMNAQFPPPGMRVFRDTRILRGDAAVGVGRVQRVLGALIIACAIALFALSAYLIVRLTLG